MENLIVARSFHSLLKILYNLTTHRTRSQILNKSPPYRIPDARVIGFGLSDRFRASVASEGRVKVCHKPAVEHIGSLKYSQQPEEPEVFIE